MKRWREKVIVKKQRRLFLVKSTAGMGRLLICPFSMELARVRLENCAVFVKCVMHSNVEN